MCKLVTGFRTKKVSTFFRTIQIIPTQKAIHICNSHQPTHKPKIEKEYDFTNANRQTKKNYKCITAPWQKNGFCA